MNTTSRQSPAVAPVTSKANHKTLLGLIFDFALIAAMIGAPFLLVRSHDGDATQQSAALPLDLAQAVAP